MLLQTDVRSPVSQSAIEFMGLTNLAGDYLPPLKAFEAMQRKADFSASSFHWWPNGTIVISFAPFWCKEAPGALFGSVFGFLSAFFTLGAGHLVPASGF
jgi:hypothetical protein